jgi:hypothetical protein
MRMPQSPAQLRAWERVIRNGEAENDPDRPHHAAAVSERCHANAALPGIDRQSALLGVDVS